MTFRFPDRSPLTLRVASLTLGLVLAATLSGCPDGAELENPDRFFQYNAGSGNTTGGTGGSTGGVAGATAGTGGGAGAGGASAGAAGAAGSPTGGAAGSGATYVWNCAVPLEGTAQMGAALPRNCNRAGCHNATDHYANLELTSVEKAREMVNKPATFGDINCAMTGMPFRACTTAELPAGCVPGTLLIDPVNFENSWVYKKLTMTKAELNCGDAMPLPPGDSTMNGWSDERKQCFLDFFRSLAAPQ